MIINNIEQFKQYGSDFMTNSYYRVYETIGMNEKQRTQKFGKNKALFKWYIEACVVMDNYFGNNNNLEKIRVKENIDLIEDNKFTSKHYEHVYKPYSDDVKMPFEFEHYDIISSRLQVIVGEELSKTSEGTYKAVNLSSDINNRVLKKRMEIVMQYLQQYSEHLDQGGDDGNFQAEVDGQQVRNDEEFINLLNTNLSEQYDIVLNKLIKYLYETLNIKNFENRALLRYLASGMFVTFVGTKDKEPYIRLVDPRYFDYHLTKDNENIDKAMFVREVRYMTPNEIIEEYSEYLTEEEVNYIHFFRNSNRAYEYDYYAWGTEVEEQYRHGIRVAIYEWKSPEIIKVVKRYDEETGEYIEEIKDVSYEEQEGEIVQIKNIYETFSAVRIGYGLFIKMEKIKFQIKKMDNLSEPFCQYTGIYNKFCVVDKAKPLQAQYNVISYLLKVAFFRAKGKGMLLDIHQMPKSLGWDLDKWLYYMDLYGIAVINSTEKNDYNERTSFNQFQQFDLTLGNTINSYIAQLEYLKREVIAMTGVSDQRAGNIKSTETVGGVERSVTQSIAITEPLVEFYRTGVKKMFTTLMNVLKKTWHHGRRVYYLTSSGVKETLELNDDNFFLQDFGIIVTNSNSYQMLLNVLKQNAGKLFESGMLGVADFSKAMKSTSIDEIEQITEMAQARMEQMQQQQQEQQQALEQQKIELQQQQIQFEQDYKLQLLELEKMKLELEKYKVDMTLVKDAALSGNVTE